MRRRREKSQKEGEEKSHVKSSQLIGRVTLEEYTFHVNSKTTNTYKSK